MNQLNRILGLLPVVIYFECIILLLSILFDLKWYLSVVNELEVVDFVLCIICLVHALFNFKNYIVQAKSSFVIMSILTIYHLVYYHFDIQNVDYYFFYVTILAINPLYLLCREIIKS